MQTTTRLEFSNHIDQYLSRAKAGEDIIIMDHGKAVAKLVPIQDELEVDNNYWLNPVKRLKLAISLSAEVIKERRE